MSEHEHQLSDCFPLIMPEQILFNFIKKVFGIIKQDYLANEHRAKHTFLYQIFADNCIGNYDLYENAVKLITAGVDNPRKISVRLFFDTEIANFPTIHITLPGENTEPGGLGFDRNFVEEIIDRREDTYSDVLARRFSSRYDLVVSSDNMLETVLIYHLLRSMLISTFRSLLNTGLEDLKFSGQDVSIYQEITPPGTFMRVLSLEFSYESIVPELDDIPIIRKIDPLISTPIDRGR